MFIANKIEQGFDTLLNGISKHTELIKQRFTRPSWAQKETSNITINETGEIENRNQFEARLTLTDKTNLGTFLSNINFKLNQKNKQIRRCWE